MKIAACLGIKDEVELVARAIAHLRAIGVDHIIASDAHSADGTEVILSRMVGQPGFELTHFDDVNMDGPGEEAATHETFARARAAGADWLLFCDADEFPMPRSGNLRDVAALARADALIISRFNVPLVATGAQLRFVGTALDPGALLLYAPDKAQPETQSRVRNNRDAAWIAAIPAPKMMARTARISSTAEAQHNIAAADAGQVTTEVPDDLFIAHVPFSTQSRFARKMANIQMLVEATGTSWGPEAAWHWRRWLKNIEENGGIAGEMARNLITAEELAEMQRSAVIKSAAQVWGR